MDYAEALEIMGVMAISTDMGYPTVYDRRRKIWVYRDDGTPISNRRQCINCGQYETPEGYDACLGYLDGYISVCCGHGDKNRQIRILNE